MTDIIDGPLSSGQPAGDELPTAERQASPSPEDGHTAENHTADAAQSANHSGDTTTLIIVDPTAITLRQRLASAVPGREKPARQNTLVLETEGRLRAVLDLVTQRVQVLRLSQEIGVRTKEQFDDRQRRVLLNEQMRAIRKELGEDSEQSQDFQRLDEAIARAGMPPEADAQRAEHLRHAGVEHQARRVGLQARDEQRGPPGGPYRVGNGAAHGEMGGVERAVQRPDHRHPRPARPGRAGPYAPRRHAFAPFHPRAQGRDRAHSTVTDLARLRG